MTLPRLRLALLAGLAALSTLADPVVVPGPQPDGSVLLHNQWPIRPAGTQVPLDDFPVALAISPSGRYAAVLHAGDGLHSLAVVDLQDRSRVATVTLHETFSGLAFSPDGTRLYCGGSSDGVLHSFTFAAGALTPLPDLPVADGIDRPVVGGLTITPDGRTAFATLLYVSRIMAVDLASGHPLWKTDLDPPEDSFTPARNPFDDFTPNAAPAPKKLITQSNPLGLAYDERRHRLYASLWGRSAVAVLDTRDGRVLARWTVGLHPNALLLSHDGHRLFVSNGGQNSIAVLDADTGQSIESLNSSILPGDLPGSTPDSLALSPRGDLLFAANAYNNNVAVFEVSEPGRSRGLGFIPTGWFPTAVRVTPDGARLVVVSARGLGPSANPAEPAPKGGVPPANGGLPFRTASAGGDGGSQSFRYIAMLYHGALGIVDLPAGDAQGEALRRWTAEAEACRPAIPPAMPPDNPVPARSGGTTPLKYVIYVIKENRTYDQVFGDLGQGNGDPALCLFGEQVTPNLHRLVREFVILDNFYANAEVSPSGHEWSTAAYSSEFLERTWPVNYGHPRGNVAYPGEGRFTAAIPQLGYLWDDALAAHVTFRDYGEFIATGNGTAQHPSRSNLPALQGHIDPLYRGWDLHYSDLDRVQEFTAELHRFEAAGEMPRLQIVRLPNDHTEAAKAGALTPRAMVAQNDLAVGQLVDAVSHSRFWPQTAIFIVEDDAQNGPDHVDAHRTEALVISPYARRHAVDSTPYTTCSMLSTMERILGMSPLSQFDAMATPMAASFQAQADLAPFVAAPARTALDEHNPSRTKAAALSRRMDFSREDAVADEQLFNRILWQSVRGPESVMPAPVHAAFVRPFAGRDPDGDDD